MRRTSCRHRSSAACWMIAASPCSVLTCDSLDPSRAIMARPPARLALLNPVPASRSDLQEATAGALEGEDIDVGHTTWPSRTRAYRPARTREVALVGRNESRGTNGGARDLAILEFREHEAQLSRSRLQDVIGEH